MSKENGLKKLFLSLFKLTALIQTFFACFWLSRHLFIYAEEALSNNYIEAAKTLTVDDYMGILYALFVRVLGHGTFLYIVQLVVIFASVYIFCKSVPLSKSLSAWVSLFILTSPFVLQCTCLVLPHAFVLADIFFMLAALRLWKLKTFFVLDLVLGFLNPDCTYLSLIALIPLGIVFLVKKKKHALFFILSIIAAFLICCEVNSNISVVYAYGNAEKSLSILLLQRTTLGHICENSQIVYDCYGEDFYGDMLGADKIPEYLFCSFGYKFEQLAGAEKAQAMYEFIANRSISKGPGYYGRDIIKDFFLYLFTPFSVAFVCLKNVSGTLIFNPLYSFGQGMNLNFVKIYMLFHMVMSALLVILTLVCLIKRIFAARKRPAYLGLNIYICYLMIINTLYATFICLRGYDYRNALFILAAFVLLPVLNFEGEEG